LKEEAFYQKDNITFDARLREKHGGDLQGHPLLAFKKASEKANIGIRDYSSPNGESWKMVNARARAFITEGIIPNYFVTTPGRFPISCPP